MVFVLAQGQGVIKFFKFLNSGPRVFLAAVETGVENEGFIELSAQAIVRECAADY